MRANADLYVQCYLEALKYGQESGVDVFAPELLRLKNGGNYQQQPKLTLLPDGYLTTTTKYLSRYAKGAEKGILGKFTLERGIEIYEDSIKRMVNNVLTNLDIHCKSCECFSYCRGRNPNLQLFREDISKEKDEYRCDITRSIFRHLKTRG